MGKELACRLVTDVVRSEAWRVLGHDILEKDAGTILWNFTGYPSFWPRGYESPEKALEAQVAAFFAGEADDEDCVGFLHEMGTLDRRIVDTTPL